ncbi:tRNA dimethylallyltransferase [Aureimonas sp. SA4125]|uniref:tRNA (adenosine(37)-N6)-dimethylallyltransferase MiaA n=1 Tax=Aureimonas sp. SA4125 TaxID=2826993 RepID=UPI001CC5DC15|nr:tRNA (adenosine(37)-N6)-dimethylallyltransferase MiaA [Aureimonas sp. SA4125]BDA85525.1 tRNA dimethylallyltransferase [Aureimonas sp. SA4125]
MSLASGEIQSVLIAGPTASGKSRLALDLARAVDGVVVNADSMQVYAGLPILSAQPTAEDRADADHRLYGHVDPDTNYSVGAWARDAADLLCDLRRSGRTPIVCGGTGLYFRALLGGIDDMPVVPPSIRAAWRQRLVDVGPERLHEDLARRDPAAAERIRPGDSQRVLRALEIGQASGGRLADLQRGAGRPLLDTTKSMKILLTPPRPLLRESIALRFDMMLAAGAIEEARALASIPDALAGTAGKAIGVAELNAHLRGEMSLAQARDRAVTRSRQYAKRQDTWFRHQLGDDWLRMTALSDRDRRDLIESLKAG